MQLLMIDVTDTFLPITSSKGFFIYRLSKVLAISLRITSVKHLFIHPTSSIPFVSIYLQYL